MKTQFFLKEKQNSTKIKDSSFSIYIWCSPPLFGVILFHHQFLVLGFIVSNRVFNGHLFCLILPYVASTSTVSEEIISLFFPFEWFVCNKLIALRLMNFSMRIM